MFRDFMYRYFTMERIAWPLSREEVYRRFAEWLHRNSIEAYPPIAYPLFNKFLAELCLPSLIREWEAKAWSLPEYTDKEWWEHKAKHL